MRKAFLGVRLRRLREEKGLTQAALAKALSLSPSYVNQLEQNQRPLTVPILLKINAAFGVDVQLFSEDEEARLVAELRDVLSEIPTDGHVALAEIRELVSGMPVVARAFLTLHRRYREAVERTDELAARLGEGDGVTAGQMPFEEVRDFFYARRNHIDVLDRKAERIFEETGGTIGEMSAALVARLRDRHGTEVIVDPGDRESAPLQRRYDARTRTLTIGRNLRPGQQAFQLATQLAFIECGELIDSLTAKAALLTPRHSRSPASALPTTLRAHWSCPMGRSSPRPRACTMTSISSDGSSEWGSRRSVIASALCSARALGACPSSSCVSTAPAI